VEDSALCFIIPLHNDRYTFERYEFGVFLFVEFEGTSYEFIFKQGDVPAVPILLATAFLLPTSLLVSIVVMIRVLILSAVELLATIVFQPNYFLLFVFSLLSDFVLLSAFDLRALSYIIIAFVFLPIHGMLVAYVLFHILALQTVCSVVFGFTLYLVKQL